MTKSQDADSYFDGYSASYEGLTGLGHRFLHKSLERGYGTPQFFANVLEIGANSGEHAPYVRHDFETYTMSDIREYSLEEKFEAKGFRFEVEDAQNLSFEDDSFDRVLSTCVLPHLGAPEKAIREIRRVLKPGGVADIYVGHDPSLAFDFARNVGLLSSRKSPEEVWQRKVLNAREHMNGGRQLLVLVREIFRRDKVFVRTWPTRLNTYHFNLWSTVRAYKGTE